MIPEQVGRYEIKSQLGQGGMASVYRGYDPRFKRDVAVKILPRQLMLDDPQFQIRFEREAETIARLEHPAIVPVYDYGEEDGQPYLVMRLMSGGSLDKRIEEGPLSTEEAARILERIGSALDRAHEHGIIHRDLKPGNILFDQYGDAFLADFGIARLTQAGKTLTATGGIVGTPAYMSPEQIQGNKVDGRSDIYALGIIVFEMLTGKKPYEANTPAMMLVKHMTEPMPHVRDVKPDLPDACEEVITRATAKEVEQRYGRAGEMAETLNMALRKGTITQKVPTPEPTIPTVEATPEEKVPTVAHVVSSEEAEQVEETAVVTTSTSSRFSRRTILISLLVIFLFTIVGLIFFIVVSNNNDGQTVESNPEAAPITDNEPIDDANAPIPITLDSDMSQLSPIHRLGRGSIESAALSPDGQKLAVGSSVGVWIYDAHALEPEQLLQGHEDIVHAVAWSPDGSRLVSGGWDNTLRLWDVGSGEQIGIADLGEQLLTVAWLPLNGQIAATTWGNEIAIFEAETMRQLGELIGFEDSVQHLRVSPNGQWLAAADSNENSTIRVWDAESGDLKLEFPAHDGEIGNLTWSPDSTQLISTGASEESVARVWFVENESPEILYELAAHEYGIFDAAYSPDGTEIVTSGGDNLLAVWDRENGRKTTDLLQTTSPVIRIFPLVDSNQYLLIQADGVILIINATDGSIELRQQDHTSDVRQITWSPSDRIVATANSDGTIRLWQRSSGEQIANWVAHEYGVTTLTWTLDGQRIISAGEDGTVRLWDIERQAVLNEWSHPDGSVSSLALSPDGSKLAVADWGGFIWLIDTELKNVIHEWQAHDDAITRVAWSPDNHHFASSGADRVVTIWDIDNLDAPFFFEKQPELVSDVTWSPNGTQVATTSHDFTVRVFNVETGEELWRREHFELASAVSWSPNGEIIASSGWDRVIRLWGAEDGISLAELEGHVGPIITLSWSSDGATLASGSEDGTAILWQADQ